MLILLRNIFLFLSALLFLALHCLICFYWFHFSSESVNIFFLSQLTSTVPPLFKCLPYFPNPVYSQFRRLFCHINQGSLLSILSFVLSIFILYLMHFGCFFFSFHFLFFSFVLNTNIFWVSLFAIISLFLI